jgi:DNA-binding LacI/PurR family transcriptional regulator
MPHLKETSSQSTNKQLQVAADIRKAIVSGRIKPGHRLPTYDHMESQYGISRATLRQVISRLQQDGFVYTEGRRGTFVSQTPPNLCRYAFVVPTGVPEGQRFVQAMTHEATRMRETDECWISVYSGVDDHADNETYLQLLRDVQRHRVAGVIFSRREEFLINSPLCQQKDIPVVTMAEDPGIPGVYGVGLDTPSFVDKGLDWLKSQKRRRIAVISQPQHEMFQVYPKAVADRGMSMEPYWHLSVGREHTAGARTIAHILMAANLNNRPDGIVIADDNLVEHALAGLVDAGVQVGKDVDVLAHCNWPWPVPSVLPIRRLGFDTHAVLARALEIINQVRTGKKVKPSRIPAVFEEEL